MDIKFVNKKEKIISLLNVNEKKMILDKIQYCRLVK